MIAFALKKIIILIFIFIFHHKIAWSDHKYKPTPLSRLIGNFFLQFFIISFFFQFLAKKFLCRTFSFNHISRLTPIHDSQWLCFLFLTDIDEKPIILLSPDIRVQTESKKHKNLHSQSDPRKKSLIDSGIELFFKKNPKNTIRDGGFISHSSSHQVHSHPLSNDFNGKSSTETTLVPSSHHHEKESGSSSHGHAASDEHHKWKLFDTIKIHTDKRRSIDATGELTH